MQEEVTAGLHSASGCGGVATSPHDSRSPGPHALVGLLGSQGSSGSPGGGHAVCMKRVQFSVGLVTLLLGQERP